MNKDKILAASRNENRNKDLPELETVEQSSAWAYRIGALVCCIISLLSSKLAQMMLYSPWAIYFSMAATLWFVRYLKTKKWSDLVISVMSLVLCILAFSGLITRLKKGIG